MYSQGYCYVHKHTSEWLECYFLSIVIKNYFYFIYLLIINFLSWHFMALFCVVLMLKYLYFNNVSKSYLKLLILYLYMEVFPTMQLQKTDIVGFVRCKVTSFVVVSNQVYFYTWKFQFHVGHMTRLTNPI